MTQATLALRHQLIGLLGVVERNWYLVKRYAIWEATWFVWTVANTLTIVFIAKGVEAAGGTLDVKRTTTVLLIGAVIWSYLGILFEILTQTVGWERWEGTIEYTFMAPLSRGTQQKVALARALLTSPVILLLDEPTTGLDPRSKLEVQDFIKEIREAHDTTILLCTHDMREAEVLSDRVGILEGGRLLHLDDVDGLLERFGAETVEDVFLAATGHSVEDAWDEAEQRLEVTK